MKKAVGPGANAFAFCVVRLLPYPQTKRFGHRRFFGQPRGDRHCYPPLAMRQACLGRVPRRSSARLAENLRPETRRFFRLESRRTPPYGRMARDETNQTGKYSVSGTMLSESLCPGLQRRTPCPRSLSDSLRACQKQSFLTRSVRVRRKPYPDFSGFEPRQRRVSAVSSGREKRGAGSGSDTGNILSLSQLR